MSIKAMTWAWGLEQLPLRETVVLLALADAANDDGVCWPSQATLARKSRGSKRSVQRAISNLREWGLVATELRASVSGRRANLYQLNVGAPFEGEGQIVKTGGLAGLDSHDSAKAPEWRDGANGTPGVSVENPSFPPDSAKAPEWRIGAKGTSGEAVDNPSFPREFAEDDAASAMPQGDTGGGSQGDTGGGLAPYIEKPNIEPPTHPPLSTEGGEGGKPVDKAQSTSPSPAAPASVDWQLLRACLPGAMANLDEQTAASVTGMLRERLEAGWRAGELRRFLESEALPGEVKHLGGLVRFRVGRIPVDGAPERARISPAMIAQPPQATSAEDLPEGEEPQWILAMRDERARGGPNAHRPVGWWAMQSIKDRLPSR